MADGALPSNLVEQWELFLAGENNRQPGLDLYPELFQHGWLFPLQRMRETQAMMRLARTVSPEVVAELGADKGSSFYHWIKCHPKVRKAIACEIRGTPYAELFTKAFPKVEFLFLPVSSRLPSVALSVERFLNKDSLSCLFIDGDKNAFEQDFFTFLPFMNKGKGLIFLHDVNAVSGPGAIFRKLRTLYQSSLILDTSEGREAAAREARGEPCSSSYEQWLRTWRESSAGVGVLHV